MKNTKLVTIAVAAVVAVFVLSLVLRFVLLSEYGVSGGWVYLGLPFGGVGILLLLLRLGAINFADRSNPAGVAWHTNVGARSPFTATRTPSPAVSQRLQELDGMRASGVISDAEYVQKRGQIISAL